MVKFIKILTIQDTYEYINLNRVVLVKKYNFDIEDRYAILIAEENKDKKNTVMITATNIIPILPDYFIHIIEKDYEQRTISHNIGNIFPEVWININLIKNITQEAYKGEPYDVYKIHLLFCNTIVSTREPIGTWMPVEIMDDINSKEVFLKLKNT